MTQENIDAAPGWDAIDDALAKIYQDQKPAHYGTQVQYMMGGPDPLDGISVYKNEAGAPHWHYISYGMSDLYSKDTRFSKLSGYGIEFTFRLGRHQNENDPPLWPIKMMQVMARYVFDSDNLFQEGHTIGCGGPLGDKGLLTKAFFAADPQLPTMQTPHGTVSFLQIIGMTPAEKQAKQVWDAKRLIALMQERNPYLITHLERPCLMADPDFRASVEAGSERDGSSTETIYIRNLSFQKKGLLFFAKSVRLNLNAAELEDVATVSRSRLSHGRRLALTGAKRVHLTPAKGKSGWSQLGRTLTMRLTSTDLERLLELIQPKPGIYQPDFLPGLEIQVT